MTLNKPLWLQAISGDTPLSFSAQEDRSIIDALVSSPGFCATGDLLVAQRAAGANFSVDVAAGRAVITGTSVADQGKYVVENTAVVNVTISGAPGAGFNRFDLIYAQVRDRQADGGSSYDWVIDKVTGTVSGSLPATPANAIPLAQVGPIVNTTPSITTSLITSLRTPAMPVGGDYGRKVSQARRTTSQTGISTITDLTGFSITANVLPGRSYTATVRVPVLSSTDGLVRVTVADGSNTQLGTGTLSITGGSGNVVETTVPLVFSAAGSQTIKLRLAKIGGTGTVDCTASATDPGFLLVLDYN